MYQIAEASSNSFSSPTWSSATNASGNPFTVVITNSKWYEVRVKASNSAGDSDYSTSDPTNANKSSAPTISTQPSSATLTSGQSLSYTLSVTAVKGKVSDALSYQWKKDGVNATTCDTNSTSSTCVLSGINADDAGAYRVVVTATNNSDSQSITSDAATITVNAAPTITNSASLATTAGANFSLTLTGSGGYGSYTFTKTSGSFPSGIALSSGVISGKTETSKTDSTASFTITITDANGATATKAFTLTIAKSISITTSTLGNASKGQVPAYSVTLAASGGDGNYVWSLDSDEDRLPAGLSLSSSGVISGTPTSSATSSSFTVKVRDNNGAGSSTTAKFTINIVANLPGKITSITKQVGGDEIIELEWVAPTSSASILSYVISYNKPSGESDDDGEGSEESKGSVNTSTNATTFRLEGLKNGLNYTITISARTSGGTGAPSEPIQIRTGGKPAAPKYVTSAKAKTGLSVRWKKSENDGGRTITHYKISCSTTGSTYATEYIEIASFTRSDEGYSYVIDKNLLSSGSSYKCKVRGKNAVGEGDWSSESESVSFAAAPNKPSISSLESTSNAGEVKVNWVAPSTDEKSRITKYIARIKSDKEDHEKHDSEKSCDTDNNATSCVITGVSLKGEFTVTLVAVNSTGESEADSKSYTPKGKTQTITTPSTPDKTEGDGDFDPGYKSNSGMRFTYTSKTASVCTITKEGKVHIVKAGECRIEAKQDGKRHDDNEDEGKDDSDWDETPVQTLTFTVKGKKPNAPTFKTITPGNTQVTIEWNAPTGSSGGTPENYEYQYSTDNTSWSTLDTVTASSTSKVITSLTNGTGYHFRVRAQNTNGGASSWAETYPSNNSGYVPFTVPNAPVITLSSTDTSTSTAVLTWVKLTETSGTGGKALISYIVTPYLNGSAISAKRCTVDKNQNVCRISGLTNRKTYTFNMVATNSAGSSATSNTVSATIPGIDQTITVTTPPIDGYTVGDPDYQLTASASSGLPVQYSSNTPTICSVSSGGSIHFILSGRCEISLDQDGTDSPNGNGNATIYNAVVDTPADLLLRINPATPSAPTITSIANGANGLTVNWSAPSRMGSGSVNYYVRVISPTSSATCSTTDGSRSCLLNGTGGALVKGTSYSITVKAENTAGSGPDATPKSGTWLTEPNSPASGSISLVGTSIRATYLASTNNGGTPITGYSVEATDGTSTIVCVTSGTTCDVTGAIPGNTYTATVYATNAIGNSTPATLLTGSVTPGLEQTITAPANKLLPITTADFASGFTVSSGLAMTYTASGDCSIGTSSGVVHLVQVGTCEVTAAQNGAGSAYKAATSKSYTITINKVAPAKATITSSTVDTNTATITWTLPAFIGGAPSILSEKLYFGGVEQTCSITGSHSCKVTGLNPGTPYEATVKISNDSDSTDSRYNSTSDPVTVTPIALILSAPEPVTITSGPGKGQIKLKWSVPTNNTVGTIIRYEIAQKNGSGWAITSITDTATLLSVVTGLNDDSVYTFKLRAVGTGDVLGDWSNEYSAKTFGLPSAPQSPSVTANTTSIVVSWLPPSSDGRTPITKYRAYINGDATKYCETSDGTGSTCTISGLTKGTAYSVKIYATNIVGNGAETVGSSATTLNNASKPVITSATGDTNSGTSTIVWTVPATDGGTSITGYKVTSSPGGLVCTTTGELTCEVTGLIFKTNYTFTVHAITNVGDGEESDPSTNVRLEISQTISFSPTSPVVFTDSSQSLNASATSGLPVTYGIATGYEANCHITSGVLIYDKVGTCRITASQAGNSRYLSANPTVTADVEINAANPDSITLQRVTAGASQLSTEWSSVTTAQLGGSTLKTYVLSWAENADFSDESSATVSGSSYTITGLLPQHTYRVRVKVVSNADLSSSWSNVLTGTPFGLPDAPSSVSAAIVVGSTPGIVTVTWSAVVSPHDGGTPITGYVAYAYNLATNALSGQICNGSSSDTSCIISGLSGSLTYFFKVASVNAVGSALSDPTSNINPALDQTITVSSITVDHGATPFAISSYASVDSGLPLSYSVTSQNRTDTSVTSRNVCLIDSNGLVNVDLRGTCTITVTQDGKTADGENSAYKAATSKTIVITVNAVKPSETQSTVVASGDTQLVVNWSESADDGGAPILGYKIVWFHAGSSAPTESGSSTTYPSDATSSGVYKIENPSARNYTLTGLTNGQTYEVYVHAYNAIGTEGM